MPGSHRTEADASSRSWRGVAIGAVVVATCAVIVAATAVVAWRDADTATEGTPDPNMLSAAVEPADSIGPDAFTPPVTADTAQICDRERFLRYLDERPDARREWVRVLDVDADTLEEYVMSLEPTVLPQDTLVTNHGLSGGKAYARLSLLEQGTAVLVEPVDPVQGAPPPGEPNPPDTVTTAATTTTGPTQPPNVVTRCKCGNPLLPPPDTTTSSSSTTSSTTTSPEGPEDEARPPAGEPPDEETTTTTVESSTEDTTTTLDSSDNVTPSPDQGPD
ncbi:MAG: hypothetical protein IT198_02435 [Acidimicrobiia bacterium]|nr:hypothetical protein [Acidimicrobiia bacterium]